MADPPSGRDATMTRTGLSIGSVLSPRSMGPLSARSRLGRDTASVSIITNDSGGGGGGEDSLVQIAPPPDADHEKMGQMTAPSGQSSHASTAHHILTQRLMSPRIYSPGPGHSSPRNSPAAAARLSGIPRSGAILALLLSPLSNPASPTASENGSCYPAGTPSDDPPQSPMVTPRGMKRRLAAELLLTDPSGSTPTMTQHPQSDAEVPVMAPVPSPRRSVTINRSPHRWTVSPAIAKRQAMFGAPTPPPSTPPVSTTPSIVPRLSLGHITGSRADKPLPEQAPIPMRNRRQTIIPPPPPPSFGLQQQSNSAPLQAESSGTDQKGGASITSAASTDSTEIAFSVDSLAPGSTEGSEQTATAEPAAADLAKGSSTGCVVDSQGRKELGLQRPSLWSGNAAATTSATAAVAIVTTAATAAPAIEFTASTPSSAAPTEPSSKTLPGVVSGEPAGIPLWPDQTQGLSDARVQPAATPSFVASLASGRLIDEPASLVQKKAKLAAPTPRTPNSIRKTPGRGFAGA